MIVAKPDLTPITVSRPRKRDGRIGRLAIHESRDAADTVLWVLLKLGHNPRQIADAIKSLPRSQRQVYRRCDAIADLTLAVPVGVLTEPNEE